MELSEKVERKKQAKERGLENTEPRPIAKRESEDSYFIKSLEKAST